jgi:hypothetical protein
MMLLPYQTIESSSRGETTETTSTKYVSGLLQGQDPIIPTVTAYPIKQREGGSLSHSQIPLFTGSGIFPFAIYFLSLVKHVH